MSKKTLEKLVVVTLLCVPILKLWTILQGTLGFDFIAGWDSRGHLLKAYYWAHELLKHGQWEGWFPLWHGGFPFMFVYPPLVTVIMGLATMILDPNLTLNLCTFAIMMAVTPVMYVSLRNFGLGRLPAAASASLGLLVNSPFTAGFAALYHVGLISNCLGFLLCFFLLSRLYKNLSKEEIQSRSIILTGVLLALLILTHTFSSYWWCLASFILLSTQICCAPHRWAIILSRYFLVILIGACLSAFWWLPFLLNLPNMNPIENIQEAPMISVMMGLFSLSQGGGLPIVGMAVIGFFYIWNIKERKLAMFFLLTATCTFLICLNTINALMPFSAVVSSSQKVRFQGYYTMTVTFLACFGLAGFGRLFRKIRWGNTVTTCLAAILIQVFLVFPFLNGAKFYTRSYSNINITLVPELQKVLAERIHPGENILTEFSWDMAETYSSPHFLSQNLPLQNPQINDLSGNLPEGTLGSEKPKVLAQTMSDPDIIRNNQDYLLNRGIRYLVTLQTSTAQRLALFPEQFRQIWNISKYQTNKPDPQILDINTFALFEIVGFNNRYGLPKSLSQKITNAWYDPPGIVTILFHPAVKMPVNTTLAFSYHPWMKVFADGKPILTRKSDTHLLTIGQAIPRVQRLVIAYTPPIIIKIVIFFSLLTFVMLIIFSLHGNVAANFERWMVNPFRKLKSMLPHIPVPAPFRPFSHPRGVAKTIMVSITVILLGLFSFSRFNRLVERPMHNDEGVNSWFLINLIESNSYKYDPANYHGPSLYYLQLPVTWATTMVKKGISKFRWSDSEGVTEASVRTMVAIAGILTLLGFLAARNRIGVWGAFGAFLIGGISPDFWFFSRYFIHEIYVVLFTLGLFLAATWYNDTKKTIYFYLACLSGSLLFCTKETSILIFLTLAFSYDLSNFITYWIFKKRAPSIFGQVQPKLVRVYRNLKWHIVGGIGLFITVWALLFSSFGTNIGGLRDSFFTFMVWTGTGIESGHNKAFPYFIKEVLFPYEMPAVILSLIGGFFAFRRPSRHGIFITCWTISILFIHSFIPYKTPWLVINILLPMILLSGFGLQNLVDIYTASRSTVKKRILFWSIIGFLSILACNQVFLSLKMNYQ